VAEVFIGSEALASGRVTRHELATKYQRVLPDVYATLGPLSLNDHIYSAWLWSRRRAVVTGLAASALYGAKWVDVDVPIDLNSPNTKPPRGVITRDETLYEDEVQIRRTLPVTTVERTAFDLARRGTPWQAVAWVDALGRATGFEPDAVRALARRHPHIKNLLRVEKVLAQMDTGAESPRETYLRLKLIDAGFPRPLTQIPVLRPNGRRYFLDMGWPEQMIAVEYDGEHHRTDRSSYLKDVERSEYLAMVGWIVIRVLADHSRANIIHRAQQAWDYRLASATG